MASIDCGTIDVAIKADGTEEAAKNLRSVGERAEELKANIATLDKQMEENNSAYRAQVAMIKAHTGVLNQNLQKYKEEKAHIELLNKNIKLQTDKIADLKERLKGLIKTEGENSDAVIEMRTEINNATAELAEMSAEAREAANEKISSGFEKIRTGIKAVCTAAIAAGTAIAGALTAAAESTREYREDQAKLITTFEKSGFSAAEAKQSYADMYAILGEDDRSVEAVNHLAKLCENEEQLAYWADICAGVSAEFGDSLPIEGLTEAANETAKVGAVTGPLADALNWAGINEEKFNESLEACNGEKQRAVLITETLNMIYKDSADKYKEMNKDIIANRDAQRQMQDATARVGAVMEPIIAQGKKLFAEVLNRVADWVEKNKGKINDFVKKIKSFIDFLIKHRRTVIAVIVGIGAGFAAWKAAQAIAGVVNALKLMKTALTAATAAQKALNIAQAATPLGMIAALLGLVVGGFAAYNAASDDAEEHTSELSEKLKEQRENWESLKKSTEENISGGLSQLEHVKSLKDELARLADESGRVKDCDKARVEFILGELNDALGTEYKLTGNAISQYGKLKDSIDAIIEKKKAMVILEKEEEEYKEAVNTIEESKKSVEGLKEELKEAEKAAEEAFKKYEADQMTELEHPYLELIDYSKSSREEMEKADAEVEKIKKKVEEAEKLVADKNGIIQQYEKDTALFLEGKTVELNEVWQTRNLGLKEHTSATKEELQKQATEYISQYQKILGEITRGIEHEPEEVEKARHLAEVSFEEYKKAGGNITKGWEEGIKQGFDEADGTIEEFATDILQKFRDEFGIQSPSKKTMEMGGYLIEGFWEGMRTKKQWIRRNAVSIGKNLSQGLWSGMKNKKQWLIKKIKSFCDDSLSAIKNFFGINSPSRKTAEMGRYLMDGLAKGIDENTKPEEVLTKKCNNISSILSEFTTDFNLDASTADSEFNYWKLLNPNASEEEIKARQIESINKKMTAQLNIIEATAQALGKTREVAGEATTEYKKLYEQLLKEKIAYEELKKSIDEVTNSQKKSAEEEYKAYKSRHEFLKSLNYNKKQMREYEENTKRAWNFGGEKSKIPRIVQNFYTKTATPSEVRAAAYKASKECEVVECLS